MRKDTVKNTSSKSLPVHKYTKFAAISENEEVTRVKINGDKLEEALTRRSNLYQLRNQTQGILKNRHLVCGNLPVQDTVKIGRSNTNRLIYSGLAACGLRWACPVCAIKISTGKADDVQKILKNSQLRGYKIFFATLTVSHSTANRLEDLIYKVKENYRKLTAKRAYKGFRDKMGIIGYIKAFEITYGEKNGWHPHLHFAYVCNKDVDIKEFERELFNLWYNMQDEKICRKGFKVKHMNDATLADYLSKWQLSEELTLGSFKEGKTSTIFTILQKKLVENSEELYKEYVKATKGLAALYIHKNLKEFGEDRQEEEILNDADKVLEILMHFDLKLWHVIRHNKLQLEIINNFERYGIEGIFAVLNNFVDFEYYKKGNFMNVNELNYSNFLAENNLRTGNTKGKRSTKIKRLTYEKNTVTESSGAIGKDP